MTRIKICGVRTPADAAMVAAAGADAVGINFFPKSPRYIDPRAAAEIVRALPPFTAPVGVFVGMPLRQATALAFQLGLRAIQTYDRPPGEDPFPFAHVPAFRVKDATSLAMIRSFIAARKPAAVLVDAYVEGAVGGTGILAPWDLLAGFDPGVPLILAGGLTPENVAAAVRTVRPWGVDVASGVESAPGMKDPGKIRAFVAAVRAAGD
ncbi:MAG TPA: phosphoribosylanthranilate isomerase [Fimbriiglobus sp.]|jgi:phosphoribosylanthranilate isomerase